MKNNLNDYEEGYKLGQLSMLVFIGILSLVIYIIYKII